MDPVTVVLADDHPIWRTGVARDLGDGFRVVGEAADADEAIAQIRAPSRPRRVRPAHARRGRHQGRAGVRRGDPDRDPHRLGAGARSARRGRGRRRRLPREVDPRRRAAPQPRARRAASRCSLPRWPRSCSASSASMSKQSSGAEPLSEREREVLQLVARGHTYKQIGASCSSPRRRSRTTCATSSASSA